MKKRGVSPVIATVLLIALVTAAAAIVFLVVIPMLQPAAVPIFIYQDGSVDIGGGNRQFIVKVEAKGGPLTIDAISAVPTVVFDVVNATDVTLIGQVIGADTQESLIFQGAFVVGTDYTLTFSFSSGEDNIVEDITITA